MQSKIVLQSYALGVDHASHESETTCVSLYQINEGMITVKDSIRIEGQITRRSSQIIFVDDLDGTYDVGGHQIQIGLYQSSEDQNLYRALRKQGCSSHEAHTAILLSGSEGRRATGLTSSTPQQTDSFYGEPKKKLPHYFGRRRF